jgi:hypothetical protein
MGRDGHPPERTARHDGPGDFVRNAMVIGAATAPAASLLDNGSCHAAHDVVAEDAECNIVLLPQAQAPGFLA